MGAQNEPRDTWRDWTPQAQTQSSPQSFDAQATAFDYWQVTDEGQREAAWAAIFGVLSEVRQNAPADYEPTLRMLMTVLEPEPEGAPVRLDATFVAARPGSKAPFEGVGWRLWRELPSGAAPSVTILLSRSAVGPREPDTAVVWLFGGYEEARSLSVQLDGRSGWVMKLGDGIGVDTTTELSGEGALLSQILRTTFWDPVVSNAYLETSLERRETPEPTPPQHPTALGLSLGDRDIDQVFTESVFAPRLTIYPSTNR